MIPLDAIIAAAIVKNATVFVELQPVYPARTTKIDGMMNDTPALSFRATDTVSNCFIIM